MVSDNDPRICSDFISKLERFTDAAHDVKKHGYRFNYKIYEEAKTDLMEFIEKHFELK